MHACGEILSNESSIKYEYYWLFDIALVTLLKVAKCINVDEQDLAVAYIYLGYNGVKGSFDIIF